MGRFASDDGSVNRSDVESVIAGDVGEVRRGVFIEGDGARGRVHGTVEPLWFWTAACFLPLTSALFVGSVAAAVRAKRGNRRISISDFNSQERTGIVFGLFIGAASVLLPLAAGPIVSQEIAFLRSEGIPGTVTVTRKAYTEYGDFDAVEDYRSNDGRYSFTAIYFDRKDFEVGGSYPGMYMGSGERPRRIFAPIANPSFLRRNAVGLWPAIPAGGMAIAAWFVISTIRENRERIAELGE